MNRTARKFLFFLFVTIFLVLAPLLVFYTAGYRYNLKSGSFLRTGVLSATTTPRGAEIIVNTAPTGKSTPYVVKQLIPGEYQVELRREGFHSWNGTVDVKSGETTLLQNILLLRDEPAEIIFETYDVQILPSPDENHIAFLIPTVDGSVYAWISELDGSKRVLLTSSRSLDAIHLVAWSANGGYLLLESDGSTFVYTVNGVPVSLPMAAKTSTRRFFHPNDDGLLYLSNATELTQVNLTTDTTTVFSGQHIDTVVLDASFLQFIDNGTHRELRQVIDGDSRLIALLPRANYTVAKRDGAYLLLTDNEHRLILVNIHEQEPLLLEAQATMFDWLSEQKLLVYSDGHEVNVYDPKTHTGTFITRQGSEITQLAWHPTGNIILLSSGNAITSFETFKTAKERQGTAIVTDPLNMINTFWSSSDGKILYFDAGQKLYEQPITR